MKAKERKEDWSFEALTLLRWRILQEELILADKVLGLHGVIFFSLSDL